MGGGSEDRICLGFRRLGDLEQPATITATNVEGVLRSPKPHASTRRGCESAESRLPCPMASPQSLVPDVQQRTHRDWTNTLELIHSVSFISFRIYSLPVKETTMHAPSSAAEPSPTDIALARESEQVLSSALRTRARTQQIDLYDNKGTVRSVQIPTAAMRLLVEALSHIAQGNAVTVTPVQDELTSQEAADLLNVSRPFLVQLLEKGDIPFHRVGTHRRVRRQHVVDYKARADSARRKVLDELAAQAQS
jgi:excisionase family DNA binding protein